MRVGRIAFGLTVLMGTQAGAQTPPAGNPFQISPVGFPFSANVAADHAGNFLVVWSSPSGLIGRRYRADGLPIGSELVISASGGIASHWSQPLAMRPNGEFVVAWRVHDGAAARVVGQRFRWDATPLGGVFPVSDNATGSIQETSIATDAQGRMVVVWQQGVSIAQDVYVQRLDASGARLGAEIRVNADTSGYQARPLVAVHPTGEFVVVWSDESGRDGSQQGAFGQRFSSDGTRLGAEFRVAESTLNGQHLSAVAVQPDGNFLVAWEGHSGNAFIRRFAADGTPSTGELRTNQGSTAWEPKLAVDASGDFVVVWRGLAGLPPYPANVMVRGFAKAGVPRGSEVLAVETPHVGEHGIGMDRHGNFVVAWIDRSTGPDPNYGEVGGRRFRGRLPGKLQVDSVPGPSSNGNGFLEPGEEVTVRPWWWNTTGTVQTLSAEMTTVTGPGNPCVPRRERDVLDPGRQRANMHGLLSASDRATRRRARRATGTSRPTKR